MGGGAPAAGGLALLAYTLYRNVMPWPHGSALWGGRAWPSRSWYWSWVVCSHARLLPVKRD